MMYRTGTSRRTSELKCKGVYLWDDSEQDSSARYWRTSQRERRIDKKLKRKDCLKKVELRLLDSQYII
jgi:hypothetical protein